MNLAAAIALNAYSPDQPRDSHGKFATGGQPVSEPVQLPLFKEALKTAARKITMYHGTAVDVEKKILAEGIVPRGAKGSDQWLIDHDGPDLTNRPPSSFITNQKGTASTFAQLASTTRHATPIIFKLSVPEDKLKSDFVEDEQTQEIGWRSTKTIPAEWITAVAHAEANPDEGDAFFMPSGVKKIGEFEPKESHVHAGGTKTMYAVVLCDGVQDHIDAYSDDEPRDKDGKWTDGGGDAAKYKSLKAQLAQVNSSLLQHVDNPAAPEVQTKMDQMKTLVKQISALNVDPGGAAGIGLPGGPKDLVIVGGGPGGLSSAVMGAADGLETSVIEAQPKVGGQAKYSSRIENYPGFPVGVTGSKLAGSMYDQATRLGADVKMGNRVTGLSYDPATGLKTVTLDNGETMQSRAVVLAGGVEFKKLNFPGANSPDVIYGNGQMLTDKYAGKPVVILGGSNGAAQAALGAAQTAKQVYLISRSPLEKSMSDYQVTAVRHAPNIQVIENDSIQQAFLNDQNRVEAISTVGGKKLDANAVGVFVGSAPNTSWLPPEIQRGDGGKVQTNADLETGMPGVYAIGDMRVGSIGRVGAAVGDGQMAERNVFQYFSTLKDKKMAASAASKHKMLATMIDRLFALDKANPYPLSQSVEKNAIQAYSPDEPRDKSGKWTTGGGDVFVSPNVEENVQFDTAVKQINSDRQHNFEQRAKEVASTVAGGGVVEGALGVWSDGAENSTHIDAPKATTAQLDYMAALLGKAANQKAVLRFQRSASGAETLYTLHSSDDLSTMKEKAAAAGIQFQTLIPGKNGTSLEVYDSDGSMHDAVAKLAQDNGYEAEMAHGTGRFIGSETSRDEGRAAYDAEIQKYESTHQAYKGRLDFQGHDSKRRRRRSGGSADAKKPAKEEVDAKSPPGWKDTVHRMKDHPEITNPYALAWWEKDQGDQHHPAGYKAAAHKLSARTTFQGLKISIETAKGETRSGVGSDGKPWTVEMPFHYGYILGTKGADNQHVDCFIGPDADAKFAYIVHQNKEDGNGYDEDKVLLGFASATDAEKAYRSAYNIDIFGSMTTLPMHEFIEKVQASKNAKRHVKLHARAVPQDTLEAAGFIQKQNSVMFATYRRDNDVIRVNQDQSWAHQRVLRFSTAMEGVVVRRGNGATALRNYLNREMPCPQ